MKYWQIGNDLYTGEMKPSEGAVEITAEEYIQVFESRTITHCPEMEEDADPASMTG